MESILTQEMMFACLGIFVIPMSFVLLFIIIARNQYIVRNENLQIEKEALYNQIKTVLAKRGIFFQSVIEPYIQWDHIDGPLLHLSTAGLAWLTYLDRFLLWTRLTSIDRLNIKYCREDLSLPHHPVAY